MEKLVYMVWKPTPLSAERFKAEILGNVTERLLELGTHKLAVNLVDEFVAHAAGARVTKMDPPISGTISFWLDAADDRSPYEEALASATARAAGYLVVESVPLLNTTHTVPLRQRTPGINIVTCIEKPERLTYEQWIHHWHGHHKTVAIETQPTFSYVRNVVVRALTRNAPGWAGIVEEGFPSEAVTDPMVWYRGEGSEEVMRRNMKRMLESVRAFLDIDRVESHPMSEYRIQG
jgi:hypothetical protein